MCDFFYQSSIDHKNIRQKNKNNLFAKICTNILTLLHIFREYSGMFHIIGLTLPPDGSERCFVALHWSENFGLSQFTKFTRCEFGVICRVIKHHLKVELIYLYFPPSFHLIYYIILDILY